MEEIKAIPRGSNKKYERIMGEMTYYFRSKHIQAVCKNKSPMFAVGGDDGRGEIFSNSLEHMGSLYGHEEDIWCLATFPNSPVLASGSWDKTIKIWNIYQKSILCTLRRHIKSVSALCFVRDGILVSGSSDKLLIVWEYDLEGDNSTVLTEHTSTIRGLLD